YHTSLDDVTHGSVGSLQHLGETGLGLARGFARADLAGASSEGEVWFDLASRAVVRWPERACLPATVAALLALASAMTLARRRWKGSAVAWAFAVAVGALLGSAASGAAWAALLYFTGRAPAPWVAHPWPAFGAAAAFGIASMLGICRRVRDEWALFGAAWGLWGAAALASSVALPGASYLVLPPLAVAGVAGLAGARRESSRGWRVAPFVVGAWVWASLFSFLPPALGMVGVPLYGLFAGFVALPLAPLLPAETGRRRAIVRTSLAMGAALAVVALAVPVFSADAPQRLNVLFVQDDRAGARWLLDTSWAGFRYGEPPQEMIASAGFGADPVVGLPFRSDRMRAAAAPDMGLAPPTASILGQEDRGPTRSVRVLLATQRGATDLLLVFPPDAPLRAVWVAGVRMPLQSTRFRHYVYDDWQPVAILGAAAEGVEIEIELEGHDPVGAVLYDRTAGLPPNGEAIERARPAWSRPSQDGDATLVSRHVAL
ncbi:MAG TPA: hypothetical protein VKU41_02540, partial [Polyangiaceae bacterium]|nr:hypothetical protein [Polyangiaceae bacterium]